MRDVRWRGGGGSGQQEIHLIPELADQPRESEELAAARREDKHGTHLVAGNCQKIKPRARSLSARSVPLPPLSLYFSLSASVRATLHVWRRGKRTSSKSEAWIKSRSSRQIGFLTSSRLACLLHLHSRMLSGRREGVSGEAGLTRKYGAIVHIPSIFSHLLLGSTAT